MPADIRPTQNLVRKAIFDILGPEIEGVRFLDLFAGSGAVGLEAISRGAKHVTFVERDPKCYATIKENLVLFGVATGHYSLIEADALMTIKNFSRQGKKVDICFLDPPFRRDLGKKALKTLGGYDILQPTSMVIIQTDTAEDLPEQTGRFSIYTQRTYGSSALYFYKVDQES